MTTSANQDSRRFRRAAGIAIPLFSLRGVQDAGHGEILDLIPFADWLARWHQGIIQLLPINETAPRELSPYNTLSAFAIDPAYVCAAQVVDVARSRAAQEWLAADDVRRPRRRSRRRQRGAAYARQLRLLEMGFAEFEALPHGAERVAAFEHFCEHSAWWLDDYALFRVLKERSRWRSWETWPEPLRRRDPAALATTAAALAARSRFFRYVQWVAATQWDAVRTHARRRGVLIKGDLPFVCGRDSADVWAHQDLFDLSSSAGAPPDAFSATGQAWGLPLYDWAAMHRSDYEWWRQRARQAHALYDLFRIDHVVGLYRTYAISVQDGGTSGFVPPGEDYQRTQGHALLSAILEDAAGAGVIAEDLGTVPPWVRASLTKLGIPGYKVLRWERSKGSYIDPRTYAPLSVATTGTHDTETLVEWWQAMDDDARQTVLRSLGLTFSDDDQQPPPSSWSSELHTALLRRLYEAGSVLTILPIQDLFGWCERINVPATVDRNNWTYRLPATADQLDGRPGVAERMAAVRDMIDETGRWPATSD